MSAFAVSALFITPFVATMIDRMGRKSVFSLGLIVNAFSCVLYGLASLSYNANTYMTISLIARSLGGIVESIALICTPSMICLAYPDNKE